MSGFFIMKFRRDKVNSTDFYNFVFDNLQFRNQI